MTRLTATEVARKFSTILNRVGAGEEVEVLRNGVPVVQMRPVSGRTVSASRWRELMESAPAVDDDFEHDIEAGRRSVAPPSGAWLS
jgi:antitoxin (DNA-binding transcriptional repressor) of toxin-antitoxin stability system